MCIEKIMNLSEIILALLLFVIIVTDFQYPTPILKALGTPPGFVLVLVLLYYLFLKSVIVGVLSTIAGYMLMQQISPKMGVSKSASRQPEPIPEEPTLAFPVTLEESVVNSMVPMVSNSPSVAFTNSIANVHNASPL